VPPYLPARTFGPGAGKFPLPEIRHPGLPFLSFCVASFHMSVPTFTSEVKFRQLHTGATGVNLGFAGQDRGRLLILKIRRNATVAVQVFFFILKKPERKFM